MTPKNQQAFCGVIFIIFLILGWVPRAESAPATPHPDGSYSISANSTDELAVQLAKIFLAKQTAETLVHSPEHLTARMTLSPDVKEVTPDLSNGFLTIRFQTTYSVYLEAPPELSSPEDYDTLRALLGSTTNDQEWTVRFFQSPETSRWHLISQNQPETSTLPASVQLWIENVNRDVFRIRTRGPQAPVLGDLIFNRYHERLVQAVSEDRALPITLESSPRDYILEPRPENDLHGRVAHYLTAVCGPAAWDTDAFPWSGSPADLMTAMAFTLPGESHWGFPMEQIDQGRWRVSGDPSLTLQDAGMYIAVAEETFTDYLHRRTLAARDRDVQRAAQTAARRQAQQVQMQDDAARRLWLASTDGVQMARMILRGNCSADESQRRSVEMLLEGRYVQPLVTACPCGVNWGNSPIHDLRERARRTGDTWQFEFNLEALPAGHIIPVELWVTFAFDKIHMERLNVGRLSSEPEEGKAPEYEMTTLFTSRRTDRNLVVASRARSGDDNGTHRSPLEPEGFRHTTRSRSNHPSGAYIIVGGGGCAGCGPLGETDGRSGDVRLRHRDPIFLLVSPPRTPEKPAVAP